MFIKATYNNEECLLNTDYIVDIFNADKWVADVYVLDIDRDCYKVKQSEIQKLLHEEEPQTDCGWGKPTTVSHREDKED